MKKKLSRLLCALLVLTMVLAMVPAVSAAGDSTTPAPKPEYADYTNTDETATVALGSTVTIGYPCTNSRNNHDWKHLVYLNGADTAFKVADANTPNKLTPLTTAVASTKVDGAKDYQIVTYCNTCKKMYTTTVTVKYAAISTFALDTTKTTLSFSKTNSASLAKGETATIALKVADKNGNTNTVYPKVDWTIDGKSVIDFDGADDDDFKKPTTSTVKFKAIAKGSATITASSDAYSKQLQFTINVTDEGLVLALDDKSLNSNNEVTLGLPETKAIGVKVTGPASTSAYHVEWRAYKKESEAKAHTADSNATDLVELKNDGKGTFTTKKTGTVWMSAKAYTNNGKYESNVVYCKVNIKDKDATVEIKAKKNSNSVYDPDPDKEMKFRIDNWVDLSAYVNYTINATWTVDDPDVAAFVNPKSKNDKDKYVDELKDSKTVTLCGIGAGKTTVHAETAEGKATFTIEVWDTTYILAPSKTPYDYTSVVTVSTDNPLATMQAKVPTHPVTEVSVTGADSSKTVKVLGNIPVPVEWTSRSIDEKNKIAKFTGELKLEKNEKYTEYVVVKKDTGIEVTNPAVTVYANATISDSSSSIKITTQPESATYNVGKKVEALKVVATGSSNLTYQWYDGDTNKPISGATKSTYTPSISKSGSFRYYCIISSGSEYVISDTAVIKISGEYRVELSGSSGSTVTSPSTTVGSGTTYSVDVQKWDYSSGKYGAAGSCTVSWEISRNSELGSVSSTSSSVTFTGKLAKPTAKSYEYMNVTATIKKNGSEVGTDEISVMINPAEASTVKQSVGSGAALKASSITSAVTKAAGSNAKVSYLVFGTPKSCTLQKSSSSSSSIGDTKCYVSTTSGQKLSDVYVKTSASSASATYVAYDSDNYVLATGTVSFDANDTGDTITASGASLKTIGAIDQITGEYANADYVKFDLPKASEGKLYYDYTTISDFGGEVKDSDKYYLDASSSQNDIEDVYFLPAAGVTGKFKIDYTAYSSSNSDLGSGTITVNIKSKTASDKFTDVSTKTGFHWAADSIDFGADNGIIKGATTYTFAPAQSLTRAQLVTLLYRAAGSPSVSGVTNPFKDTKNDYSINAILWAYKNNIVTGTSATTFSPESPVTREQIAAILYRYMGSPTATGVLTGYTDRANVSTFATTAMQWAIGKGYINGIGTKLDPKGNATRAQVAVILHRFLTK